MLEAIVAKGFIFYAMGAWMVVGIFAKVISHIIVGSLVKEAREIQKSNHRFMHLIKSKFEHASMISDKVQNVEVFVKKYLYEYKALGLPLEMWRGIQLKAIWSLLGTGLLGGMCSYQVQGMNDNTFLYFAWTGILTILSFVIQHMSDEQRKLEAAKNYMVDYLENVCVHRYEKANQDARQVEEVEITEKVEVVPEPEYAKEREEQEKRIRAILEEFLA